MLIEMQENFTDEELGFLEYLREKGTTHLGNALEVAELPEITNLVKYGLVRAVGMSDRFYIWLTSYGQQQAATL